MTLQLNRREFTVTDYYKMAEVGILKPTDRVELIHGQIIQRIPQVSKHSGMINCLTRLLIPSFESEKVIVSVHNPIHLNDTNEPRPDLVIAKFDKTYYSSNHPTPKDIYLVIEVADSSLEYDRTVKKALYADAAIPEYWIVNLQDQQVEVFSDVKNGAYTKEAIITSGTIKLASLDWTIKYEDLF